MLNACHLTFESLLDSGHNPVLQMRLRDGKWFVQGHTAVNGKGWLEPRCLSSKARNRLSLPFWNLLVLGTFPTSQLRRLRLRSESRGWGHPTRAWLRQSQTWVWVPCDSYLAWVFSVLPHTPPLQEVALLVHSGRLTWVPQGCQPLGCEGRWYPAKTKHTCYSSDSEAWGTQTQVRGQLGLFSKAFSQYKFFFFLKGWECTSWVESP